MDEIQYQIETKPVISPIRAFDPTKSEESSLIYFTYAGGEIDTIYVEIQNGSEWKRKEIPFEGIMETVMSFSLKASILEEFGVTASATTAYEIRIAVKEKQYGLTSMYSNVAAFYYLSTPTFELKDLTDGTTKVDSSNFSLTLIYEQTEGEQLNSFKIDLYDSDKTTIVQSSNVIYDTTTLCTEFQFLEDDKHYFIKATGETKHGMALETRWYEISVEYDHPSVFSRLELENVYDQGYIKISSNVISLEGENHGGEFVTVPSGKSALQVTGDDQYVIFDEGFLTSPSFTISVLCCDMVENSIIATFVGSNTRMILRYCANPFYENGQTITKYYFTLQIIETVPVFLMSDIYTSEEPRTIPSSEYEIIIRKSQGLHLLEARRITS